VLPPPRSAHANDDSIDPSPLAAFVWNSCNLGEMIGRSRQNDTNRFSNPGGGTSG
jgi:hypothetical protein